MAETTEKSRDQQINDLATRVATESLRLLKIIQFPLIPKP